MKPLFLTLTEYTDHFRKAKFFLTGLLLFLTAISYHPRFISLTDTGGQTVSLSKYIVVLSLLVLLLSLDLKNWLENRFVKTYIIVAVLMSFILNLFLVLDMIGGYTGELKSIIMSLMFIMIGFSSGFSKKEFCILTFVFSASVAFALLYQIIINIGGFVVADVILTDAKNSLGAIGAVASTTCFAVFFMPKEIGKMKRDLFLALGCFLLVECVTILARAAMIAVIGVFIAILYQKHKYKHNLQISKRVKWILLITFVVLLFVFLTKIIAMFEFGMDYVSRAFFRTGTDGDITAGRTQRNLQALEVFKESPLFGRLVYDVDIPWVHNYLLRILSDYGLLGGSVLLFLYFYIIWHVFWFNLKNDTLRLDRVGFLTICSLLIISLAEPTFPYSPGTAVFYAFFALGYGAKNNPGFAAIGSNKGVIEPD